MTSLHVICGLAPLPIKNPGYAYGSWPFTTTGPSFLKGLFASSIQTGFCHPFKEHPIAASTFAEL